MCGLVGCVGQLGYKHEKVFKDLLRLDVLRGPHSTGIAAVTTTKEVLLSKSPLLPDDLLSLKKSEEIFRKGLRVLIGHNRFATVGAINASNSHPFENGKVVGAHNGTVDKWRLHDHAQFNVDSEAIINSIDVLGLDETLKSLNGKFALTWYDQRTQKFNFIRNKERPLYVAFDADADVMFWASEEWMLYVATSRNDVKIEKVFDTEVGFLYQVDAFKDTKKSLVKAEKELPTFLYQGWAPVQPKKAESGTTGTPTQSAADGYSIPFTDAKIGDMVDFTIEDVVDHAFGAYAVGVVLGRAFKVRIYLDRKDVAQINELKTSIDTYRAEIAGYRLSDDQDRTNYVMIDRHEMVKLDDQTSKGKGKVKKGDGDSYVSDGVTITRAMFMDPSICETDCQWCGMRVYFDNHPKYAGRYLGLHGFICDDCQELETVKEFLNL